MEPAVFMIIQIGLRITGILVCSEKAKSLNRSSGNWGLFGFLSPILAMIWIQFMSPIIVWDKSANAFSRPKV